MCPTDDGAVRRRSGVIHKIRSIAAVIMAVLPLLPRGVARPLRSATRSVERTNRRLARVQRAVRRVRG